MVEPDAAIHDGGIPAAAAKDNTLTCEEAGQNHTLQKTSSGSCASEDNPANAHDKDRRQEQSDDFDNDCSLPDGFWERQARRMARNPCCHLWMFLVLSILLSIVGMVVGKFTVSGAETGGWQSRGTMIADRQTQLMLLQRNAKYLFNGGETAWVDLTNNVQSGWEDKPEEEDEEDEDADNTGGNGTRHLASTSKKPRNWIKIQPEDADLSSGDWRTLVPWGDIQQSTQPLFMSLTVRDGQWNMARLLQNQTTPSEQPGSTTINPFPGCDIEFYTPLNMMSYPRLWPIWKMEKRDASALDPQSIYDICVAETKTQDILKQHDLCFGCDTGCLPPFSIVLYARWVVPGGFGMTCEELRDDWAPYQDATETSWKICVQDIKSALRDGVSSSDATASLPPSCPPFFSPTLVDKEFDQTYRVEYTSSIFATREDRIDELFELAESFHQGSDLVKGVYDTQWSNFNDLKVDEALITDAQLSMCAALVAIAAMIVHTKSLFLTAVGLIQIVLSFPLSYLVYKLMLGLNFFPFLNFIGIFIVFALGTDDIFVAMDKWKNARLEHPTASTEFVAAKALPDAAVAMFLTTITTAIAFFATAVCPVAPIKMFAVFCGLLVMFDYFLNILLVFPALCIYDGAVQNSQGKKPNCLVQFGSCRRKNEDEPHDDQGQGVDKVELTDDSKLSLIRRVMLGYYDILHITRWGLLAICVVALGVSGFYATKFSLPENSDVRMLDDSHQFEKNWLWKQDLLQDSLNRVGGSRASVIWGVKPADTGDKTDPNSWSQLVLDPSFDASSEEAQVYLLSFCDDLYSNEFSLRPISTYTCPMQEFNSWLEVQSKSDSPDATYLAQCGAATGIPVAHEKFDSCIVAWSRQVKELTILSRNDKVVAMYVPFISRHQFDVPYDILNDEWHRIEDFIIQKRSQAPSGVHQFFWSSFTYWWYDTNGLMLQTAYSSVGLALFAAAAIILMASRSFRLTLFSTITIAYVLASVTATLVALGWHLGFLEAICFAILVGVSVDFVIHFSHAYAAKPGYADRGVRAQHALVLMGPSVLAAAFTTIFSAVVMLFCVITFFQKFSLVLCFGIIQSTVGAFVFFITLVDCFGPCEPTEFVDNLLAKCPWVGANAKQLVSDSDSSSEANPEKITKERSLSSDTSANNAVAVSIVHGESAGAGASSYIDEDSIGDVSICSA